MSARKPLSWAFLIDSVEFTPAVIAGETSLGGSESAALGLARALRARGHDVHVFTTKLSPEAAGMDATGLQWHHLSEFRSSNEFIEWDVCVALRMWMAYSVQTFARLRLLWNQDLLVPGGMVAGVMAITSMVDRCCYVSEYHRQQWQGLLPDLAPIGWVTRNGIDLSQVPTGRTKDPNRIIHISRPERGLGPLLTLWPKLRERLPTAELRLCRYSSMYDQGPGSWSDTCAAFDRRVEEVNKAVGGITYLGELTKLALYREIADAAVMWYPGVSTFAETSCIAAIEAQACGTPFVGSYRGALPETAKTSFDAGLLIKGEAEHDPVYADAAIASVLSLLGGCRNNSVIYRKLCQAGIAHAQRYDYATIAAEWEAQVWAWFADRYETQKIGVLRQLLWEDDHVAAKELAQKMAFTVTSGDGPFGYDHGTPATIATNQEACQALAFCDKVIAGKDQGADDYAEHALPDPVKEAELCGRFKAVVPTFDKATRVLDVACGNGAFAIALAMAHPTVQIVGLDYAAGNIERAKEAAARVGVADRCHFEQATVYDFDKQQIHDDFVRFVQRVNLDGDVGPFDGLFVGEFVEHVGNCTLLVDWLEEALQPGARVVYTCPHGACMELMPRGIPVRKGHVHRFHHDDLKAVWGPKQDFEVDYLSFGLSPRGNPVGNWIVSYTVAPDRQAGIRPIAERIVKTRPLQKLSVGMIVRDVENDLGRCLASVYRLADEIVVGDTGSTDTTRAIAESYGARVIDVAPIEDQPEGFAGARNAVLDACSGDWFLWIDADEILQHGWKLRGFLDTAIFHGYVLHQTHVYLDGPPTFDVPQRVFRLGRGVRFYGCVHEQPQAGDPNVDIAPALDLSDPVIAHTGYLTEDEREEKRVTRNKPLLLRDQQAFPTRELGKVLLLREAVIEADHHRARHGGELTPRARIGYQHAINLFVRYFDDPGHKFAKIARPWYEAALRHLRHGWEAEVSLFGKPGGLQGARAKPEMIWVRDGVEFQRLMEHRIKDSVAKMAPVTFRTEPFEPTAASREVVNG